MFSENDRRNIIIGSLLVIVLTIACVATIRFYKSSVPEQVERDTLNITEADYTQAVAKWRAQNVSEYEMTLHSGADDVTLRVNVGGTDVPQVLKHSHGGSPVTDEVPAGSALLRRMTVDLLFQYANQAVAASAAQSGAVPSHTSNGEYDFFRDYTVRFDQNRGYPTYFATYQRKAHTSREIVWRETIQAPIEIRALKVIR